MDKFLPHIRVDTPISIPKINIRAIFINHYIHSRWKEDIHLISSVNLGTHQAYLHLIGVGAAWHQRDFIDSDVVIGRFRELWLIGHRPASYQQAEQGQKPGPNA